MSMMPVENGNAEQPSIGYLINLLARLLAQSLRARNGVDGILPGQFPVVLRLLESEKETQKSLSDHIRVGQATMAHTLKRMERTNIIERRPLGHDRRQFSIHLTPKGMGMAMTAVKNAAIVNRIALERLNIRERELLRSLLADMAGSLSEDLENLGAATIPETAGDDA